MLLAGGGGGGDGGPLLELQPGQRQGQAQARQLHVAGPDRPRRALQQLLEVHPSETSCSAYGKNCKHPFDRVPRRRRRRPPSAAAAGGLHGRHPAQQQGQGHPLRPRQRLAEERDGEGGGGEDLPLGEQLVGGRREVGEREVAQEVLCREQARGHRHLGQLPRAADRGGVDLRQGGRRVPAVLPGQQAHAEDELEGLVGHDGGPGGVQRAVAARPGVAHQGHKKGVLYNQSKENASFHPREPCLCC
mmetsp:Transcript_5324/g.7416  ORF Transcript_5324/g.7416 Transcript_5324/m.7416 type:complete len:246 (-) Transcript_5324:187-924(-)